MKKLILLILLLIFSGGYSRASSITLNEIRQEFYLITVDSKNTPDLLEKLYAYPNPTAIILGYTAATEAIMAKVAWNPYAKFNYLFKSKKTFLKAIKISNTNAEVRFLRFAVQHHLPKYLGLSKDLSDDKNVIIDEISKTTYMKMDEDMIDYIMRFMINSNRCSDDELQLIESTLSVSN